MFTQELQPLAATVKKAVRQAVVKAGDDVLHDKDVKDTMKQVVKQAVKEAVKDAVHEGQDALPPEERRMSTKRRIRCRGLSGLVALVLCVAGRPVLAGQGAAPSNAQADDAAGFKEFSAACRRTSSCRRRSSRVFPP